VTGLATERIVSLLAAGGIPFTGIGQHRASLEDVYMAMTREHTTFAAAPEDQGALA
jgi:ABC-2 type transport system ATP-binding protein